MAQLDDSPCGPSEGLGLDLFAARNLRRSLGIVIADVDGVDAVLCVMADRAHGSDDRNKPQGERFTDGHCQTLIFAELKEERGVLSVSQDVIGFSGPQPGQGQTSVVCHGQDHAQRRSLRRDDVEREGTGCSRFEGGHKLQRTVEALCFDGSAPVDDPHRLP